MASKEESINLRTCRKVLRSFSFSETEPSVQQNLHHSHTHHYSLMCQWVAAEDALEMAHILDAKRENVKWIIEEEQAHRAQVTAFSQIQL